MDRKSILIAIPIIMGLYVVVAMYSMNVKHGKSDSNNIESRIIIENNSTKHIEEGDSLIVEEISGGTIILVPYDQSNLIP